MASSCTTWAAASPRALAAAHPHVMLNSTICQLEPTGKVNCESGSLLLAFPQMTPTWPPRGDVLAANRTLFASSSSGASAFASGSGSVFNGSATILTDDGITTFNECRPWYESPPSRLSDSFAAPIIKSQGSSVANVRIEQSTGLITGDAASNRGDHGISISKSQFSVHSSPGPSGAAVNAASQPTR